MKELIVGEKCSELTDGQTLYECRLIQDGRYLLDTDIKPWNLTKEEIKHEKRFLNPKPMKMVFGRMRKVRINP